MVITQALPDELDDIVELLKTRGWDDTKTLERGTWFIARDGAVVGCVQIVEVEPGHSVIDQVLVHEDRRHLSIGRRLLRAAMDSLDGAKYLCCHPELLVFYGHFGFEDIGYRNAPASVQDYWRLIEDYPADDGHVHHFLRAG